jgi:hypothetical protein
MINQTTVSPQFSIPKKLFKQSVLLIGLMIFSYSLRSQSQTTEFGYTAKGDSIEFIFGQEKTIIIGKEMFILKERFNEISGVNVAGDFNNWNPRDIKYVAVMGSDKLFRLKISKKQIGKKGETRQFKFVINQQYWVEPPKYAINQFTGKDGNTNLTLKL